MSDRHFDELATRFAEKIYGGAKGAIRLAVLQADLAEALPDRPLRILDIGAGLGHMALWLAERGHQLTLAEPAAPMLDGARARFAEAGQTATFALEVTNTGPTTVTGAMGIPTLDGLGVQGAMAHTLEEHIEVASLAPRAIGMMRRKDGEKTSMDDSPEPAPRPSALAPFRHGTFREICSDSHATAPAPLTRNRLNPGRSRIPHASRTARHSSRTAPNHGPSRSHVRCASPEVSSPGRAYHSARSQPL